ncbi:MAG: choice-of-anchor Q domain-containing protein [bacterium]
MSLVRRSFPFLSILSLFCLLVSAEALAADCAVTNPGDSGAGTLRNCLDAVATVDGDVISIPAMTVQITSGQLNITHPLTIQGAGAADTIIDGIGNGTARLFNILTNSSAAVRMQDLTVQRAHANVSGAGIYVAGTGAFELVDSIVRENESNISGTALAQGGGGIYVGDSALLNLQNSEVRDNSVVGNASGAGILSTSNLLVVNSLIFGNDAMDTLAGTAGIDSQGAAQILFTTFEKNNGLLGGAGRFSGGIFLGLDVLDNSATAGGGGLAMYGDSALGQSYLMGNRATDGNGGGIYACGDSVLVENTTLERNYAQDGGDLNGGGGGGIFNCGALQLQNVTLFKNEAQAGGGGIENDLDASVSIFNSSIFANTADSDNGGAMAGDGGGIFNDSGATLTLVNSILAGNGDLSGGGNDCRNLGSLGAQGKNILQDSVGCENIFSTAGAIENLDPLFVGGLADNSGPLAGRDQLVIIPTLALQESSPAVDTADLGTCLEFDARGFSRPQRAGCDIGAYELLAPPSPTPIPTPASTDTPMPGIGGNPQGPGAGLPSGRVGLVSGGGCQLNSQNGEFPHLSSVLLSFGLILFSAGAWHRRRSLGVENHAKIF